MLAYALARRNIIINQMYNLDNDLKIHIYKHQTVFLFVYIIR